MPVRGGTNAAFERLAFVGAMVFVASIPLEGLLHLGILGSLAKGGGAVLVVGAFFAFLGGGLRVRRTDGSILLFGAFVAWAVLSYFWSADKSLTLGRASTNMQLFLATLVLWQFLGTAPRVRVALQTFVVSTFFGSVYSILARHPHDATGVARYSVGGPNSFGIYVVWAMLAAYWLLGQTPSKRWKQFYALFFVVGTIEVFDTASRTALVVLCIAVAIALADRRLLRPRNVAIAVVIAAVSGIAILHVVSSRQLERLGTVSEAAASGANGRTTQWRLALDVFSAHPVEGLGAAVFRDYSEAQIGISRVAHNSFLGVAADLGVVGLVLFAAMFVFACRNLHYLPPTTRRLWFGLAAVWLLGANTLTWENQKFTYFVLAVLAAQSVLVVTGRAREAAWAAPAAARSEEAHPG
ncbi:MAG TPA: O-antigen ligase family protein [Acidimicrobiales bacterium]|nr:O-antigen ligase family protein [Acidimicrobiales bacterium]